MRAREFISEKWSQKYKRSINCERPRGFSQRAHCAGRNKTTEAYNNDLNQPRGPEFKPTMPRGTVRVDVSDVYDWYKLGRDISNLDRAQASNYGKGPPSTIVSFGDEDTEHRYIKGLERLGLATTDIDPVDPKQPVNMPRQKIDPTYNVDEGQVTGNSVKDLEQDLKNPLGHSAIDHMMRAISRARGISPHELHDLFVAKHGCTPDAWVRKQGD